MGKQTIDELVVEVGAEVKGLKTDFNKVKSELDRLEGKVKKSSSAFSGMGGVIAGALSVGAVILFTKKINDLAVSIQATNQKALVVFGSEMANITAAAKDNALQMGLTKNEYIGAAASMQDLLVPLGFARKEAAGMSKDVLNLSGALAVWSGGTKSAKEVSTILTKALLGEAEQMKTLGVTIDQSSTEFTAYVKKLQAAEGLTLQQAKATAILKQISEKTTDAQTNFTEGTKTMAQEQAIAQAQVRMLSEELATQLTPAITGATSKVGEFLERISDMGKLANAGLGFGDFFQGLIGGLTNSQSKQLAFIEATEESTQRLIDNAKSVDDLKAIQYHLYNALDSVDKKVRGQGTAYAVLNQSIDKVIEAKKNFLTTQAQLHAQTVANSIEIAKNGKSINVYKVELKEATDEMNKLGVRSEAFSIAKRKVENLTATIKKLTAASTQARGGTDIQSVQSISFDPSNLPKEVDGPKLAGVDEETKNYVNAQAEKDRAHMEFVEGVKTRNEEALQHQIEMSEAGQIVAGALADALSGIGSGMLSDMAKSEKGLDRFVASFTKGAIRLISTALSTSLANSILGATSSGAATGPAAVFTTPAFIASAIATTIGAFATIPKLAEGGIAFGRSLVEVGEYSGASGNPEVIAPLDKLKSIIGNTGGSGNMIKGDVTFRIDGEELVGVLRNYELTQKY